jgi:2-amino-4-hydroxy-6-hydroxymethyldihydropteridine diphosphokinase
MTHHVVLSLGANLGDPLSALTSALESLAQAEGVEVLATSSFYGTAPIGGPDQPDYINAVAVVETTLAPMAILALAHQIEADHDRVRQERWGPRTLDIDLVVYDDVVSEDPTLTIPHPRAHQRAFVLVPWHELEPDAVLATFGPIADLIEHVKEQDIAVVAPPHHRGSPQ